MKLWKKIMLGILALIVLVVGAGAYSWFNREAPPIRIAEPGVGGQRIMLGTAPANYFAPSTPGRHPAVLLLGGSEGSLKETRNVYARALAAEGYAVLYPGYYLTRDDNRSFNMVPLETFDEALAWMAAQPGIDPNRIAIVGHSKGAEAALLVAARHPEIRAVVAAMPSAVVWQGFDMNAADMSRFQSSWSEAGRALPHVPYDLLAWYEWFASDALLKMYQQSWQRADAYPDAAIPVERMQARLLLICGGQDAVWPSCDMSEAIQARLAATPQQEAQLLRYPDAGHWGFGPINGLYRTDRDALGSMGGTAESDLAARRDQWPQMLAFLSESLSAR